MNKVVIFFLLFIVVVVTSSSVYASCLNEVADFAESICGQIQTSGNRELTEANGELKAEVSGIVRKVLGNTGGTINGKQLTDAYENVLREDLAKELFNVRDCRIKMVEIGKSEACLPKTTNSSSRTCQYTSGFKAGQKEYFPPSVSIVPALIGQQCQDGKGSWGYAIQDQIN